MGLDGLYLHFLKEEIKKECVGAKIDKVYQPTRYELVLALRTRTSQHKLFISVGGNSPRINLTQASFENPANPPMLCMLLRKQLTGAIITDVRQAGTDRILFIDLNATDEIGDRVNRTIVVEIMAQYSNCILLDENGMIIDALKRVDSTKSSFREVLPKLPYTMPPSQDKLNIAQCSVSEITDRVKSCGQMPLQKALLNSIAGFSPLVAKEVEYRVCLCSKSVAELTPMNLERLEKELSEIREMVVGNTPSPCILTDENDGMLDFSWLVLTLYSNAAAIHRYESPSVPPDKFWAEKERLQRTRSKADDLFKNVNALIDRTTKKINVQLEELAECDSMEEKRVFAELINANLWSLSKGDAVYRVQNYYDDYAEVEIEVSPLLTPSQNSQKYYKEYRKLQTAQKILSEQIEKGRADLEYLLTVKDELERATGEKEIAEIRNELSIGNFLKSRTGTKNKKNVSLPPLEFVSPGGLTVLVGRNNLQNDNLSFKKARKTDIWFHAQKTPGSHVVLCTEGGAAAPADMEFAAQTAAYYSSVRARGMVEVDYTEVRNLKKPPVARPGFVIYHVYNTLYVKAKNPVEEK